MLQPLGNMKEDHSPPSLVPAKWLSFSKPDSFFLDCLISVVVVGLISGGGG